MAELSLREQLAKLMVDTTNVLHYNCTAVLLTEHDISQILSLIRSEIEKQKLTDEDLLIAWIGRGEPSAFRQIADAQHEADLKVLE